MKELIDVKTAGRVQFLSDQDIVNITNRINDLNEAVSELQERFFKDTDGSYKSFILSDAISRKQPRYTIVEVREKYSEYIASGLFISFPDWLESEENNQSKEEGE